MNHQTYQLSNHSSSNSIKRHRLAFIGGGYDSAVGRAHRTAIDMDQRFVLVAGVFSRNKERNYLSSIKYGLDENALFFNVDEMIEKSKQEIDAVVILTPQSEHYKYVIKCIENNIPVICEKSLAGDVSDVLKIKDSIELNNGFLAVTYNYTGYPMVRELQQIVQSGELGSIQQIHLEMPQEGFLKRDLDGNPVKPQKWRLNDEEIPTLSLDLGVHLHGLVKFIVGCSPKEVVSSSRTYGNFNGIIDNVQCLVKYTNDIEGTIWYGKTALGNRNGMKVRIFGNKGSALWIQEKPENLYLTDVHGNKFALDRGNPNIKIACQDRYQRFKVGHPAGFIEAFANYYYDIADMLEKFKYSNTFIHNNYVFGVDESLEGLKFLEAVTLSSKTNKWVTIN